MNYDLQAYIKKDDGLSAAINTRSLWPGMYVLEAKGLADYGKPKNIVTESYADGHGLRHFEPADGVIFRDATDVTLRLFFCDDGGINRYVQYDSFIDYVKGCAVWYWDSVRKRKARLLFTEKCSPTENFHGQIEYIEAEVKFKNVDGYSVQTSEWSYSWSTPRCAKSGGSNTGIARNKTIVFTNGVDSVPYNITDAFSTYGTLTDYNFENMTDANYATRLNAFNSFVISDMTANHIDFAGGISDITDGASEVNTHICPLS